MKDKVQRILVKEGLQPAKFAEMIGVQRSSISHILSGRNKPSFDMIQGILKSFPKISADWLLLGKGDMYRQPIQGSLFTAIDKQEDTDKGLPLPSESQNPISPTEVLQNAKAPENRINESEIERVVVFFKNRTFTAYNPNGEIL
ncbi:MAG: helix-turn-helix transcriptional regulator [Bacteroidales bacterium]|jgi:transcriptional regulator with XRE-family HTH domain|nr:helix-turn-helix transcriptional regulator [Bacteroidales bacterium]MDD4383647.1 helix-turn-helix transcriptional regulator [Bacteroidales bacterium]MDY0197271.1 helix-turn-helix transcriptional regulator [Tenuifilaceae bacterium]